jgi:hypothetical protein
VRTNSVLSGVVLLLLACGHSGEGSQAPGQPAKVRSSNCDTAFVFDELQPIDRVLSAMRLAEMRPVEVRYQGDGRNGGIGSPGHVETIQEVEEGFQTIEEQFGTQAEVVAVRVRGIVGREALGRLGNDVSDRMTLHSYAVFAVGSPGEPAHAIKVPASCR